MTKGKEGWSRDVGNYGVSLVVWPIWQARRGGQDKSDVNQGNEALLHMESKGEITLVGLHPQENEKGPKGMKRVKSASLKKSC